ncbi:hypothetical protein F5050DRAFT_1779872 [Lentinula boryana]|uniref:Uncharacterized protein n=1 Tax=Lentinula boryana TaxID=40481 RepID=A0ABQ8Q5F9_9AGAR|nr:hypothetical protein F5050DRAFT_1779872 [Lentinula boryana]
MEQHVDHVELVVLQTGTLEEQDDAQIEELLSSFYFDNSVKRQSTADGSSHSGSTGEHLHPIYEEQEDGMFYDLYGALDEEEQPCSICESSDDEEDSEASSQYGPKEIAPNIERNPSSFWPVIEEGDSDEIHIEDPTFNPGLSSHVPQPNIISEDEDENDDEEWEQRGRSRAVPARLVRRAGNNRKEHVHRLIHERQGYEGI